MKLTLHNYLSLEGCTIDRLAKELGKNRETVRLWSKDKDLESIVHIDHVSLNSERIVLNKSTTHEAEVKS